jgi:hypothetical protein
MSDTINLGGFPSIIYINNEIKKKREFEKKITKKLNTTSFNKLNLLNIIDIKKLKPNNTK